MVYTMLSTFVGPQDSPPRLPLMHKLKLALTLHVRKKKNILTLSHFFEAQMSEDAHIVLLFKFDLELDAGLNK